MAAGMNETGSAPGRVIVVRSDPVRRRYATGTLTESGLLEVVWYDASESDPPPRPRAEPVRGPGAGCGRNAPCPCGSGRKYKRCKLRGRCG